VAVVADVDAAQPGPDRAGAVGHALAQSDLLNSGADGDLPAGRYPDLELHCSSLSALCDSGRRLDHLDQRHRRWPGRPCPAPGAAGDGCSRVRGVPQIPAMLDWVGWMSILTPYAGLDADIGEHLPALFAQTGLAGVNAVAVIG
jgi:hypothetical protein